MTIGGPLATLLEMAALNNGFDRELPREGGWLVFASTQVPLKVWLQPHGIGTSVAFSQSNVAKALDGFG